MSTTSQSKTCPKCAGHIPADSLEGLCPRCLLLGVALPTETGKMPASKGTPPTLGELSAAFPNLELLELIGQGGMGFVFKARQPKLNRFVALKILPQSLAADSAFAERFIREGRLLARLNHPQIVAVHDFGQANGFFYLLMEFVDGVNLRQALKAGRMEPVQALAIVPKICDALQYAHSEGVLHRDIKPENILLDTKGRVKIADFGIAKLVGERAAEGELTTGSAALGTPHYMAPEQLEKPGQVDHRADVYSLGVVFYEMLTGELPIGRFVAPSEKSRVDPRLDEVVLRTLEKERERRTQSAGEVKTQVETIASSKPPGEKTNVIPQEPGASGEISSRSSRVVLAITLLVILLLGTGLVLFWGNRTQQNAGKFPTTHGEPFTKQIVFTRATNHSVGDSNDVWNVVVWSDTIVEPGEMLLAMVRRPEGSLEEAQALLFTRTGLREIKTSTALSWFFGPLYTPGFNEADAEVAAAQLREKVLDKPLWLSAGEPYEVFSVTNISGAALKGYVQYLRSVPEPTPVSGSPAAKPHAIVHIRGCAPYVRSVDYSVKLPPGYALRGTANAGEVSTHFSPSLKPSVDTVALRAPRGEYHTTWFPPPVAPGTIALDPERLRAQEAVLGQQLRELLDRGPLQVFPGEPFQVFAITNLNGEVQRGFFELVSAEDNARTNSSTNNRYADAPAAIADTPGITNVISRRIPARSALPASAPAHRGLPKVDPATGLPLPVGNPGAVRVDPATGLPTPVRPPVSSKILPQGPTDVLSEARELTANGNFEAALGRYLSYYERSRSSSTTRPPLASALAEWIALGEKYPKARQALIEIQDRGTRTFLEGQGSGALFVELADVNNALKEDAKTWLLFKALAQADPSLAQQCYLYAEELLVQRGEYDLCLKFLGNVQRRYQSLLVTFSAEQSSISNYLQPGHQPVQHAYANGRKTTSTSALSPAATNVWTRIKQAREDRFAQQIGRWAEILVATGSRDEAGRICEQALTVLDHPRIRSCVRDAEERVRMTRVVYPAKGKPDQTDFTIAGPPPVKTNITALSAASEHWQPASGEKTDLERIRNEGKILAAEGKYEEALQRHVWFHNHALEHDPNQRGVRLSYALSDWVELGRRYPKAKDALLEIRDWNTRMLTEGRGTVQAFKDTAAINREYGCEDATFSLFKAIQQRDPGMARKCYDTVEEVLVQKGEYDLCYAALGNYLEKFAAYRQEWENGRAWETNISAKLSSIPNRSGGPSFVPPPYYDNHFIEITRRLIEVLLGTGHATEAAGLQDQAVAALDDPRLRSAVADANKRMGR